MRHSEHLKASDLMSRDHFEYGNHYKWVTCIVPMLCNKNMRNSYNFYLNKCYATKTCSNIMTSDQ